jgi:hypothetical protein
MERLELLRPAPVADLDLPDPAAVRDVGLQDLPVAPERRPRRRGLRAFALTGAAVGLAVALLLPPSLSEQLPGTSGNDRAPLAAQPPASAAAKATTRAARRAHPPPVAQRATRRSRGAAQTQLRSAKIVVGTGDEPIGTLRIDRPMRLVWAFDGRPFSIVSAAWSLRPRANRGTTILSPGTYRGLTVKSTAKWTIRLVPARGR